MNKILTLLELEGKTSSKCNPTGIHFVCCFLSKLCGSLFFLNTYFCQFVAYHLSQCQNVKEYSCSYKVQIKYLILVHV